jgi:hypothetical protein
MPDLITAILAIWGAVLGTLGAALHGLRWWWDRPQLRIEIDVGFMPDERVRLLGFEPTDPLVFIGVTKLGQGSVTVQGGGFTLVGGGVYFVTKTIPKLPAKLAESERLTFIVHRGLLVKKLSESGAKTVKQAYCKTTDGKMRKQTLPKGFQEAIRQEVDSWC